MGTGTDAPRPAASIVQAAGGLSIVEHPVQTVEGTLLRPHSTEGTGGADILQLVISQ